MLLAISAWASEPDIDWVQRHFTTAQGLPVGSASATGVDQDGFLWVATHDGLARFDGRRFQVYDMASQPAMDSNRIAQLHTDPLGRLIALTQTGTLLEVRSNRIWRIEPDPERPGAQALHLDPQTFCITLAASLVCLDEQASFNTRLRFDAALDIRYALPGMNDSYWLVAADGAVWLRPAAGTPRRVESMAAAVIPSTAPPQVRGDGSLLLAYLDRVAQVYPDDRVRWLAPPLDAQEDIVSFRQADDGSLWVASTEHVHRLDPDQQHWTRKTGTRYPGISASFADASGRIWITQSGRLYQNGHTVLVSAGEILDLQLDGDGTLWLSTLRDGIYALSKPRVARMDRQRGLLSDNIYGLDVDPSGRLWLGSLAGMVQMVDGNQLVGFGTEHGLPGENPWVVAASPDGTIYSATYLPGLFAMAPGSERFQQVELPEELAAARLRALSFDSQQRLWVGSGTGVWMRDDGLWFRQWPEPGQVADVRSILHASDGARWYGTSAGLWRDLNAQSQAIAEQWLAGVEVRDVYEDGYGSLWVSSQGQGLIHIDGALVSEPGSLRMTRFGRREGLPSNSPHAVREDSAGHLWVNSNQGIFRISRVDLEQQLETAQPVLSPLVLAPADGLLELEGNGGVQPAAAVDGQGRIWFPTQSGAVIVDPLRLDLRSDAPLALIDEFLADGQPMPFNKETILDRGQRSVSIRFAAADLRGGQERFRYRLLALERGQTDIPASWAQQAWTDLIEQSAVSFSALAPGRYRFEVLAGNSDGLWSGQVAELVFIVPAYLHETPGFRLGLLSLGLLVVGLLIHYRIRTLRQQAAELNRQVERRTRELATEKSRVEQTLTQLAGAHESLEQTHDEIAQRNRLLAAQADRLLDLDRFRKRLLADVSHELRTPLMLIDLPLRELDEQAGLRPEQWDESGRRNLSLARSQTERLGTLVSQLVTLIQAESGQLDLKIKRLDLDELIDELLQSYRFLAQRRDITLKVQRPETQTLLFADHHQLTTAIGNLVDNAIKHAPTGSRIDIIHQLDDDESMARIVVVDQGHGFDPAIGNRLFERFFRHEDGPKAGREGLGIGLALAREIVELHGGRMGASSQPGAGASFWIELPLGSSHIAIADLALDQPGLASSTAADTSVELRGDGIALVEDHPELAAYLKDRLTEHLPVSLFNSAEQALAELEHRPFGLLLSDVMLPGVSGFELCQRVREHPRLQSMPVILISAKATDSDRDAGLKAGADGYLVKPFSLDELFDVIGTAWPAARPRLQGSAIIHPDDPLMIPAIERLSDPEFGIDEWAGAVHLSVRQLRRRMTEVCGQSPLVWLREQRLIRVRNLISSGECKTLAEAGARSGIDNPGYLYRLYRARFGEK